MLSSVGELPNAKADCRRFCAQYPHLRFEPREERLLRLIACSHALVVSEEPAQTLQRFVDDESKHVMLLHNCSVNSAALKSPELFRVLCEFYGLECGFQYHSRAVVWKDVRKHRPPRVTIDALRNAAAQLYGLGKTRKACWKAMLLKPTTNTAIDATAAPIGDKCALLEIIPQSLLWLVFPLDVHSLLLCEQVCKAFQAAVKNPTIWSKIHASMLAASPSLKNWGFFVPTRHGVLKAWKNDATYAAGDIVYYNVVPEHTERVEQQRTF
jgi:hypothetical protein